MKAPASIQWFFSDFLAGVAHLTAQEVGSYILLLGWSWANGPLPTDDRLRKIARCPSKEWDERWLAISDKFTRGDGGLVNERLERSRAEALALTQERSASGSLGARRRWQTHGKAIGGAISSAIAKPLAEPMANAWQSDSEANGKRMAKPMANAWQSDSSSTSSSSQFPPSYLPSVDTPTGSAPRRVRASAPARKRESSEKTAPESTTDDGQNRSQNATPDATQSATQNGSRAAAIALAEQAHDLCDWLFDRCVELGVIGEHWTTLRSQWLRDSFEPAKVLVATYERAEIERRAERMITLVKANKIRRKPDCATLVEAWDWASMRADPQPPNGISATAAAAANEYLRSVGALEDTP